ncbi:MAG TPA: FAD-binding oxidoreductase, partial [Candidatus Acidoferrales bacterium]|nr:FAD-binding oxidoreductase [Candidatus Acidoferrales bacterium]
MTSAEWLPQSPFARILTCGGAAAARSRRAGYGCTGYAAQWITARELAELEPDIDPNVIGDGPVMFFRNEGWLDPVPHTHAMLSAAIRTGAALHTGSRVIETRIECGRVVQVKTASGATFNTEVAVRYAGRWVSDVARLAGVTIPLAPTVGLLVTTTPAPTCLRRIVLVPDCDLRPDGAGRLRLHMEDTDADASAGSRPRSPGRPGAAGVRRSQGGSGQKRHTTNAG